MSRTGPPYWFVVAFARLVPLDRWVVQLAAGGRTYRQVGMDLGLTTEAVRRRAYVAMTSLRPPLR